MSQPQFENLEPIFMWFVYIFSRPRRREPAGRRVRQRPPSARRRPAADRGAGAQRGPAVRYLKAAARQPRMRLEDSVEVRLLSGH